MNKKSDLLNVCTSELSSRHINLKKYFPFFELMRLNKTSGKYKEYEISSIVIAILHFMLIEGKLKEKGLSFNDIESFLSKYIIASYGKELDVDELREFTRYILLKLQNEGEPFKYEFYDPKQKKLVVENVRYIVLKPSYKSERDYVYHLTPEGIDFFLQTKEFGEESKVTIYLLLLQKQLQNNDFESVYNSIVKINTQVQQQIDKKREIAEGLMYMGGEGFKKYMDYSEEVGRRLKEEHDLFSTTYKMVQEIREEYIRKVNIKVSEMKKEEQENIQYLWDTDRELSLTIEKHSNLLKEIVSLKKDILDIRKEKRKKTFKQSFDFEKHLNDSIKSNSVFSLSAVLNPLLRINLSKNFNPLKVNPIMELKFNKVNEDLISENIVEEVDEVIVLDDLIKSRVKSNYHFYFSIILNLLIEKESITLEDVIENIKRNYGLEYLLNPDFTAFLFSLNSNRNIGEKHAKFNFKDIEAKDSYATKCESIYKGIIDSTAELSFFKYLTMEVKCISGSYVEIADGFTVTNFKYER